MDLTVHMLLLCIAIFISKNKLNPLTVNKIVCIVFVVHIKTFNGSQLASLPVLLSLKPDLELSHRGECHNKIILYSHICMDSTHTFHSLLGQVF